MKNSNLCNVRMSLREELLGAESTRRIQNYLIIQITF